LHAATHGGGRCQEYAQQILKDEDGDLYLSMDWHPMGVRQVKSIDVFDEERVAGGLLTHTPFFIEKKKSILFVLFDENAVGAV
jgi:hypothetical protein